MDRYRHLHLWMIIPMIFMQIGLLPDYWGDFSDNAWSVHIHFWSGVLWYLYLIIQPYYATRGQIEKHRTNGIIGMFIAGGVGLTALSMMHRDIVSAERSMEMREAFGAFEPWFFYGVAAIEIPMILAFMYAVIQSIIHRKSLVDHAWWLISTVFIIMMPALSRGIQLAYVEWYIADWPNVDIMPPVYFTQTLIIGMALFAAAQFGKLRHPATYLVVGINLFTCLLEPLGRSELVQGFLLAMLKG